MKRLETTLLILRKKDQILLAMKKRGFGEGRYNGVGGKLKPFETFEQAMIRETEEEIGVTPTKYELMGINEFYEYVKGERTNVVFYLYLASEWEGTPTETDEMRPEWFNIENIPFDQMFPDDIFWMHEILNGKKVKGFFEFDEQFNLLDHKIEIVDKLTI